MQNGPKDNWSIVSNELIGVTRNTSIATTVVLAVLDLVVSIFVMLDSAKHKAIDELIYGLLSPWH